MRSLKSIIPILLVLVGLGVGFFGGYEYRNYRLRRTTGNFAGTNGTRFMGRNATFGSILSIDNSGITVKLADGSSKIVLFTGSTTYSNTVSATKSDLKVGENVAVFGASNSDGSVSATNVQINPEFFRPSPTPASK